MTVETLATVPVGALMVMLATGATVWVVAAGCAAIVLLRGVWWLATWAVRRPSPVPVEPVEFVEPEAPPVVRRPCHTTKCGHMTTPHEPHGVGVLICRGCGHITAE